jgi:hypothetical protein
MGSTFPTYDELYATMTTGPTTGGWDLICSYSIDVMNAAFRARRASVPLRPLRLTTPPATDPITGEQYTITFSLELDEPTIAFSEQQSGLCSLSFALQKASYEVDTAGKASSGTFSPGTTVTVTVPVAALLGDTIAASGVPIVFDQSSGASATIVLHIRHAAGYAITGDSTLDAKITSGLTLALEAYLRDAKESEYVLAEVPNGTIASDAIVAKPRSFIFVCQDGVLRIHISAVGSQSQPSSTTPSFQPAGKEIVPIPQGHTASIIVARDFFMDCYLKTALARHGTVSRDASMHGLTVRFVSNDFSRVPVPSPPGPEMIPGAPVVLDFQKNGWFQITFSDRLMSYEFHSLQDVPMTIGGDPRVVRIEFGTITRIVSNIVPVDGAVRLALDLRSNLTVSMTVLAGGVEQTRQELHLEDTMELPRFVDTTSQAVEKVSFFDMPLDLAPFYAFAGSTLIDPAVGISFGKADCLRFPTDVIVAGSIAGR